MTLKTKLFIGVIALHLTLTVTLFQFYQSLGGYLIALEVLLLVSLFSFLYLIHKGLEPLEYIDTFSAMLEEGEFTSRFSQLKQPDLDRLVDQFNAMLNRLHQERLRLGEQRSVLEKLMKESPVGVLLLDYEQRITELNPATEKLFNTRLDQVKGQSLKAQLSSPLQQLLMVPEGSSELLLTDEGKRLKVAHFQIYDRGFNRSFFMINELTGDVLKAQKNAYEKLIRLMSHEVNNTIAISHSMLESSLSYSQLMAEDDRLDFEKAIQIVMRRSESLNRFMQAYADVVKLPQPVINEFNLSQMLNNLITLFHAECEKRRIEIHSVIDESVMIKADAHLIEQALVNVIKNAIEAIEHDGSITISLQQKPLKRLIIQDTGCGIAEKDKQHLFTPFFTTKESGQGVGLMLIDEILRSHEINYSLKNNPDSNGASFVIDFAAQS